MGGEGGFFLINQETSFGKKMQKRDYILENIFIPVFFALQLIVLRHLNGILRQAFIEIKIRGKFLFKIHSAKTKKYVFSAFFVNIFQAFDTFFSFHF